MSRRTRGLLLILLGAAMLFTASTMYFAQQRRDKLAGETSAALAHALQGGRYTLQEEPLQRGDQQEPVQTAKPLEEPVALTANGYGLLGILRVEGVSLELPVLSSWSYELLDIGPCRYSGSLTTGNLVIMGHNYESQFRPLWNAEVGMTVELTDAAGFVRRFTVAEIEILAGNQAEDLPSDAPLTLFTCTPDGRHRRVLRCTAADWAA